MANELENKPDITQIKERLDKILEKNVRKFDSANILGEKLNFGLSTLACLYLAAEREDEVEASSDAVQKRYSRMSFLNDLSELGMEIDDDLMASLQSITDNHYVVVDAEGAYHCRPEAIEVVDNLNRMFSGMPGMSLVAYVVQTIEEIVSGRKEMAVAEEQFDKALASRGAPLTFIHLRTISKSAASKAEEHLKKEDQRRESKKASERMQKIFSKKLLEMRGTISPEDENPSLVTKRAIAPEAVKIREISPHKIKEQKERKEREERERFLREQEERRERERLEEERQLKEKEKLESLERERFLKEREAAERLEREVAERLEKERLAQEKLKEELELLRKEKEERERLERERLEKQRREEALRREELAIEEQIAAFEKELAIPCPICKSGEILTQETESGREYFKCSDPGCRFVSWSKPYHFSCPVCKSPFLVEFTTGSGIPGLKCPRAACSYLQNSLGDPMANQPPFDGPFDDSAPKKRKVVRKRRVAKK